jgi:dolichol-phosphate mannosyltransferase
MQSQRCPCCGAEKAIGNAQSGKGDAIISVVIPVFNEALGLAEHLRAISSCAAMSDLATELIVVDDGSTDSTWRELEGLIGHLPGLVALRLSRNFGKEAAICAGLAAAAGDACIIMDSDLQHPPALIPEMIALWRNEGWDVVEGVKNERGQESLVTKMGARTFNRALTILSGHNFEGASDFKLLDRKVVDAWSQLRERNTFFRGMVTWLGYRRKAIPFTVAPRAGTKTRWSFVALLRLAMIAITAFSSVPLQLVTILGIVFLIGAFLLGVESLYVYFSGQAFPGFTTVILLELIIGGVLMLSLGIIGTYIARIYEEAKQRPRYVVAELSRAPTPQ